MKQKLLPLLLAGIFVAVFVNGQAMATPMVGSMSATVFDVSGQEFTSNWIGKTITVAFTFDDENNEFHEYNDGANGIAEFGKGDDSLNRTYSTAQYHMYSFLSDAEIFLPIELSTLAPNYALNIHNISRVGQFAANGDYSLQLFGDGLNVIFSSNISVSWVNPDNNNSPNHLYLNSLSVTTSPAAPVPEPATMLLIGTGLVGLACRRIRRDPLCQ